MNLRGGKKKEVFVLKKEEAATIAANDEVISCLAI